MSNSTDAITYSYNDAGQVTQESHGTGILNGYNVTLGYNDWLQLTSIGANTSTAVSEGFTYKNSGLMDVASYGTATATYSYASNSKLVSQILFKQGTTTRLTTTRSWDYLNRLLETRSTPAAAGDLPTIYRYSYNDANQRITCTMSDGSYWVYQYDGLGQVVSGKRFWGDGTPVAGQQFEYGFDDIGNRKSAKFGGDASGHNLQSATYTPNLLNQYSQRTVPGIASVLGIANPNAAVTVNSQSVYRKGEYFWKELSVANGSASVWQSLSIQAVNGGSSSSTSGNQYIPRTPETYTHDLDGNLTADGRWNYTWDAENRLVRMVAATANGPQQRIDFTYDPAGRRTRKQVWNNTAGTGTAAVDLMFLYEGWNLLSELNALNSNLNIRNYLWGTDMSGTRHGAGGVGGLLAITDNSSETSFVAFDGNGNVVRLVEGGGSTTATYEYAPFGESLRATGSQATWNPLRFSTKYHDSEGDLTYFGYRFYSAATGRWLSRDPVGTKGGRNVYVAFQNSPIRVFDGLGLRPVKTDELNDPNSGGRQGNINVSVDPDALCSDHATVKVTIVLSTSDPTPDEEIEDGLIEIDGKTGELERGKADPNQQGDDFTLSKIYKEPKCPEEGGGSSYASFGQKRFATNGKSGVFLAILIQWNYKCVPCTCQMQDWKPTVKIHQVMKDDANLPPHFE